jgi:hypothetical protein
MTHPEIRRNRTHITTSYEQAQDSSQAAKPGHMLQEGEAAVTPCHQARNKIREVFSDVTKEIVPKILIKGKELLAKE